VPEPQRAEQMVEEVRCSRVVHRWWVRPLAAMAAVTMVLSSCNREAPKAETEVVEDQLGLDLEGMLARQARIENLIRDCMKAQGFEYVPIDPHAQRAELVGVPDMSEEDFAKQHGYGITTLYEQRRKQQEKLGPNEAIRAALSEPERATYDRALFGDHPDATFADAVDTGDFSRLGGCTKQATEKVFGGAGVVQSIQQKLDELDERILADARMVDAIDEWSKCMRADGYPFEDPEEVDTFLMRKLDTIVGPSERAGESGGQPAYDKAALASLQREEVAIYAADIECEERRIAPVEDKVRAEYEQAFREQNADLISKVPPP
jgi:hypothetical protein